LGERGDSEVLCWSSARAGAVALADFAAQVGAAVTADVRASIDAGVRRAAYTIIEGKGATWYGIGAGLARIVAAIARDQQAVLSGSARSSEVAGVRDVCVSPSRIVGAEGVSAVLIPELGRNEREALARSASPKRPGSLPPDPTALRAEVRL
jgi:L-lactate dehydrogenase